MFYILREEVVVASVEQGVVLEARGELGERLRRAAQARRTPPEALAAELLDRALEREALRAQAEALLTTLTPRERQVAWRAARGQTNRQIARALVLSPETVKSHVASVLRKLGLRSKVELRVLLLELGLRWWEAAGEAPPPGG